MASIMQDLRYALRQLRKAPGFTLTAVLTLALGIGATTAMYRVVQGVLLAPLPYPAQDRLVGVAFTWPQEKPNAEQAGTSADFLKEHSRSFSSVGISEDGTAGVNLATKDGHAFEIASMKVDRGYFPTLGVQPMLGRNFTAEEDLPNGPKSVLLSYLLWKRQFNGDTDIVNRIVRIDEESYTVVGVMPASLEVASESAPGTSSTVDIWQPLQLGVKDPGYGGENYKMMARLRDGVSITQAQQELSTLNKPFYKQFPDYLRAHGKTSREFRAWPLQQVVVSDARTSLLTMLAAVLAVLLVACLNLSVLMTSRTWRRTREMAVRSALGASRGKLLRLMMCESLMLALVGGNLGLWLSQLAVPLLLATAPIAIPPMQSSGWLPAGFALLMACVTTLIFGLLPGWSVLRRNAGTTLQSGGQVGVSVHQARMGDRLMVAQVAVAVLLLSAASLLLGSFLKLRSVASGVEAKHLTVVQVTLKGDQYASTVHTAQFINAVLDNLKQYPGVARVAAVNGLPLDRGLNTGVKPVGRPGPNENVEFRAITPGYFRTLGIPLLSGRDITADDNAGAVPVVLVSETAARRWWPGHSAIGEEVDMDEKTPGRVIGVVADTHGRSLAETPRVTIYSPFAQLSDPTMKVINGWFPTTFAVRLSGDVDGDVDIAAAIQRAVANADPEIPVAKLTTMQTVIDNSVAAPRFFSYLAGGFAGFALLLTMIGLFGLMSYQVAQRTREIGVRLAVGADPGEILLLILRRGLLLTALGVALGSVASLAVPRLVGSVLSDVIYTGGSGIEARLSSSSVALAYAAIGMLLSAALASYMPAQRAASIEPTEALRTE